jgi:prephenate dehydratase
MVRTSFIVISSRKMKMIDEGQVDRRRFVFLVENETGKLRKLLKDWWVTGHK